MDEKLLLMMRDTLWELIVAHEKGEISLTEEWLHIITAQHSFLEDHLQGKE